MGIRSKIKQLFAFFQTKQYSEKQYYTNLFTKNPAWSNPEPNGEELLRWGTLEGLLASIPERSNLQILDLGCGRGWLSNLLTKYGEVTAIEPVQNVVNHGRKLFPHLDIKCGTSKDLIKDGYESKFDLIVSSEVIEHIPDKSKATFVGDIFKLLKPTGYTIITTPRKDVEPEWNKYTAANQPVEDWLSEQQLKTLFQEGSFEAIDMKRFGIPPAEGAPIIDIYQLWLFQKK